jgi:hypothetical protein
MSLVPFDSIYRHGFVRVAVCVPRVRLGSPAENTARTIALAQRAQNAHATIAVFPELGLSGYSNEDLFHQDALLDATRAAIGRVANASRALDPIIETEISPELIPGEERAAQPKGVSEAVLGPFALHDFFLYYVSRFGHRPSRVIFLAEHAWHDRHSGVWPDETAGADGERPEYDRATIKRWMVVFLHRFFETSQFKRSALPNAPKVGSGGSLSPRSDWRAPSDGHADLWLQELEDGVPE